MQEVASTGFWLIASSRASAHVAATKMHEATSVTSAAICLTHSS